MNKESPPAPTTGRNLGAITSDEDSVSYHCFHLADFLQRHGLIDAYNHDQKELHDSQLCLVCGLRQLERLQSVEDLTGTED